MGRSVAVMLVLVFLVALCLSVTSAFSSADLVGDSWVSKASMRQERYGLGVVAVNGRIYAIGGTTEKGAVGTNEEYDPAADTWVLKMPMPTPRNYFAIAA